ncbi:MAG: hypothetical protein KG028_12020 [Actinobacteria bacterium]|nr:hypothetical protein [Actinomycetota bacterium]
MSRLIAAAEGGLWGVAVSALLGLLAIIFDLAAFGLIVAAPILVIAGAAWRWRTSEAETRRGVRRLITAFAVAAIGIMAVMLMVQPGEECRDVGGEGVIGRIECEPRQ